MMRPSVLAAVVTGVMCMFAVQASAQAASRAIHGAVTANNAPLAGADVFVLETLEGTTTNADGRFTIRTQQRDSLTLTIRHLGFRLVQQRVLPGDSVVVVMEAQAAALTPFVVQAGSYTAGDDRRASLTSLQVASTPGATADVARAIQTLPGVQNVDEGTGLFVRGGDVTETKVLLNDAAMLSPYNYETPTGNFTTTVNPFLLEGIFFSSGGFGARYGNVLSGVADLHTRGRPTSTTATVVAGLAAVSAGADLALDHGIGVHATAALSNIDLLMRLNGSTRDYTPPPNGHDLSASVVWNYRPSGEVRTFAINRTNALGIAKTDPSTDGGYSNDVRSTMTQASWKDVYGSLAPMISVSYATANRAEVFGPFELGNVEELTQVFAQTAWSPMENCTFRAGGEADWRSSHFDGSLPTTNRALFDSNVRGTRAGAFVEGDARVVDRLRVVAGLRTDRGSLAMQRTLDPRFSTAFQLTESVALTGAWGVYHQVADPLYYDQSLGAPALPPMRSEQSVIGMQAGSGEGEKSPLARLEVYDKQYSELAQLSREKKVVGHGIGDARGADAFLRGYLKNGMGGRMAVSYVNSRRTEPVSGLMAPAPFDVTWSGTAVLDVPMPSGWSLSGAYRYATGKPFTPVIGAAKNASAYEPVYGAPNSERIDPFTRIDLSMSHYQRINRNMAGVFFLALNNLMDKSNVYQIRYNEDYTRRIPIRSLFNRSVYVGGSLTFIKN